MVAVPVKQTSNAVVLDIAADWVTVNARSRVLESPSFASAGAAMDRVAVCACASTAANPRNSGRQSRTGSRPRRGLRAAAREPAAARAGVGAKLSEGEAGRGVAERPLGEREGSGREANRPRWRRHEDAGRAARLGSARLGSAGLYHRHLARMSSEIRRLRQPRRARWARFDQCSRASWIHSFPTLPRTDRFAVSFRVRCRVSGRRLSPERNETGRGAIRMRISTPGGPGRGSGRAEGVVGGRWRALSVRSRRG